MDLGTCQNVLQGFILESNIEDCYSAKDAERGFVAMGPNTSNTPSVSGVLEKESIRTY